MKSYQSTSPVVLKKVKKMNEKATCDGCGRLISKTQLQELIFQDVTEDRHGGFRFKAIGDYCYACRLKIKASIRSTIGEKEEKK